MNPTIKRSIFAIIYTGWSGLGFIRGVNSHNFTYNNLKTNEPYLYSDSICNGFYGIFIYANPFFVPVLLYKEAYRLEVKMRNLENEKKSSYYNKL